MLSPSIFFGTVLTVITSLQVFDQPFIVTGGGRDFEHDDGALPCTRTHSPNSHGYASAIAWARF